MGEKPDAQVPGLDSDNSKNVTKPALCGEVHFGVTSQQTSTHTQLQLENAQEFEMVNNRLRKASSVTVERRPCCPAHDHIWPKATPSVWLKYIGQIVSLAVQLILGVIHVLCPPWPPSIMRKTIFRAPPVGKFYYLVGGVTGARRAFFNASDAIGVSNLQLCLPHLINRTIQAVDIYYHLLRSEPVLIEVVPGTHICAVLVKCEQTIRYSKRTNHSRTRSPVLIIYAQPNSSDLGSCMLMDPNFSDMADFMTCDMLSFDYPGYGVSDGEASEKMIHKSTEKIYDYAVEVLGYSSQNIILMGFSLGTAAVMHVAATKPQLGALVLIAPFTSFARVATNSPNRQKSWRFDLFRSVDKTSQIRCPTLICHGGDDIIVHSGHGKSLYDRIRDCRLFVLQKATHQGIICERQMWDQMESFIHECMDLQSKWADWVDGAGETTTLNTPSLPTNLYPPRKRGSAVTV